MNVCFPPPPSPDLTLPEGDLWVFGYGSLMWRPGFAHLESLPARLHGYHRALCVWSWVHRGTEQQPGLVLGLDLGGSCLGRAIRVAAREKQTVADYLYAREMVTPVYQPALLPIRIDGQVHTALTFTIDRAHPQYAGKLSDAAAAKAVRDGRGVSGANPEYLANTVAHLDELGINDGPLHRIAALLGID